MNERMGAAAIINRHFQTGETTCHQLSKRLPDNRTIFTVETTAIILDYYRHTLQHDVGGYFDSLSCLQAIEGEYTEHSLICQITNLPWAISDKGTCFHFGGYKTIFAFLI